MPLFSSVFNNNTNNNNNSHNKDDDAEDEIASALMKTKINTSNTSTTSTDIKKSTPSTPRKSPTTLRTPKDNGKYDMDSNILSLARIFNIELCHTDHDSQKFERDLVRMLKVISMVVVKKKQVALNSSLIGEDDLMMDHCCEFEEMPWKTTGTGSVHLFIDFINGIGKLFNGDAGNDDLPTTLTEEQFFEIIGHRTEHLDEHDIKVVLKHLFTEKHPHVIRYLSGIAQLVVVSTLGKLVSGIIATKAPLQPKDVRGSWTVQFRRYEAEADLDDCSFGILHERTDCIMKKENAALMKPMYNFKWQVEIKFKSREILDVETVHVRLVNIEWICDPLLKVSETEKEELINACKQFFSSEKAGLSTQDKCPLIPSGQTLIECVCRNVPLELASYPSPSTSISSQHITASHQQITQTTTLKPKKKNKHEMSWLKKLLLNSTASDSEEIFAALSSKSSSELNNKI